MEDAKVIPFTTAKALFADFHLKNSPIQLGGAVVYKTETFSFINDGTSPTGYPVKADFTLGDVVQVSGVVEVDSEPGETGKVYLVPKIEPVVFAREPTKFHKDWVVNLRLRSAIQQFAVSYFGRAEFVYIPHGTENAKRLDEMVEFCNTVYTISPTQIQGVMMFYGLDEVKKIFTGFAANLRHVLNKSMDSWLTYMSYDIDDLTPEFEVHNDELIATNKARGRFGSAREKKVDGNAYKVFFTIELPE